ncbi:hypothetical protein Cadr_000027856 [Camelus dromedarius]|uniref:Uncharacterized protein n=1 Tax=Camelus dromedarius TaxID=9838 RepID=A0A5N4CAB2_CAMDR|nr:hypothetical protein Cadr_000027856 [Camelus dromedarius]
MSLRCGLPKHSRGDAGQLGRGCPPGSGSLGSERRTRWEDQANRTPAGGALGVLPPPSTVAVKHPACFSLVLSEQVSVLPLSF